MAASPTTWGWGHYETFGNFTLMLSAYGLPHNVDAMRSFVTSR